MITERKDLTGCNKTQLAMAYSPHATPEAARHTLRRWIRQHPTLLEELKRAGYTNYRQQLTPLQLNILFQALGMPT